MICVNGRLYWHGIVYCLFVITHVYFSSNLEEGEMWKETGRVKEEGKVICQREWALAMRVSVAKDSGSSEEASVTIMVIISNMKRADMLLSRSKRDE